MKESSKLLKSPFLFLFFHFPIYLSLSLSVYTDWIYGFL